MNLGQLRSQFQLLCSAFPYSSYTASVDEWLDQAQREVGDALIIDDRATTQSQASTSDYDLPDNLLEIKKDGVFFDGALIDPANLSLLISLYGVSWKDLEAGTPTHFLREGENIILVPASLEADKTIEVHYLGYANDLVETEDMPFTTGNSSVGFDYHNHLRALDWLLLDYAIGMAEYSLGKYTNLDSALNKFYNKLAAKTRQIKKPQHLEIQCWGKDPLTLKRFAQRQNNG